MYAKRTSSGKTNVRALQLAKTTIYLIFKYNVNANNASKNYHIPLNNPRFLRMPAKMSKIFNDYSDTSFNAYDTELLNFNINLFQIFNFDDIFSTLGTQPYKKSFILPFIIFVFKKIRLLILNCDIFWNFEF